MEIAVHSFEMLHACNEMNGCNSINPKSFLHVILLVDLGSDLSLFLNKTS